MLIVNNLSVYLNRAPETPLVRNISFELEPNQCLGILGESGSGKSLTCNAINGLLDANFGTRGEVYFQDQALFQLSAAKRRALCGEGIAMIMQSPMSAFNPLFTIKNQAIESILAHQKLSKKQALVHFYEALESVNLRVNENLLEKYPHQLSGGMLQRIMIALALVLKPSLIIADEPTTAIDYISQREVVKQLQAIREHHATSIIFVSHDLSLLSHIADKVLVMQQGNMVEYGETQRVFSQPQHAYTRYLIDTRMRLVQRFNALLEHNNVN